MATKDCRAAFPRAAEGDRIMVDEPGMTLRQYAAVKMASGLVSDGAWADAGDWKNNVVRHAVRLADALIVELDRK